MSDQELDGVIMYLPEPQDVIKYTTLSNTRKLRYMGKCSKCGKETKHRFVSATLYESTFECLKCLNRSIGIIVD